MTATCIDGLVSTIVPVHNRAELLREAVTSVLAQSYRPIEIVIVDDGSTDATAAAADALAAAHPGEVHVVHQANAGPGLAREAGRQRARGEFIQYLDSDDVLLPGKFERQVGLLAQRTECGVAYGPTRYRAPGTSLDERPWKRTGEVIESMFPAMLQSRWWGTSTPLYRRTVTEAAGAWLGLSSEEDWEYDCRVGASDVRLCFVPEFVSEEREHPGPRQSRGGATLPGKLADRARAHFLIFEHAQRARVAAASAEMQHFARELFLLARQCGAAGLGPQSRDLFRLARVASGPGRAGRLDFRLYAMAAAILGWPLAGRLACASDRLRR